MGTTNNRMGQAQWTTAGVVMAPVEQVWADMLANQPLSTADKAAIAAQPDGQLFTTSIGKPREGRIHIEIDKQHHRITTQGEWWYRGVQSVEAHAQGSLLTYRVYNIAPGIGWWAAQLVQGRNHGREMKRHHQQVLQAIGARLGCTTYPVE